MKIQLMITKGLSKNQLLRFTLMAELRGFTPEELLVDIISQAVSGDGPLAPPSIGPDEDLENNSETWHTEGAQS